MMKITSKRRRTKQEVSNSTLYKLVDLLLYDLKQVTCVLASSSAEVSRFQKHRILESLLVSNKHLSFL